MPANYVLLEKITVGSGGASSVTFSNIPQTGYTDLIVKGSVREASTVAGVTLCKINSSTTGYTIKQLYGTGSAAASDSNYITAAGFGPDGTSNPSNSTASTFSSIDWYFPNYTSANYKSISIDGVNENNGAGINMGLGGALLSNTAAITSLTFAGYSGNFAQYTTFYLYGVAKLGTTPAIVPYATGGDTIMTDGTYWYHAFKSSGTFTPAKGLSCDVLVVAGGGGGQLYVTRGGGGGAGGLLAYTAQSLASGTAQTVTVGAGGSAGIYPTTYANNGSNSQFGSLTASVGGGRGNSVAGGSGVGGSGGGGSEGSAGSAGTSGQGNAGGSGTTGATSAGGGGGATAVGANALGGGVGGAGGAGSSAYSSWGVATSTGQNVAGTYWYAGGGGGGGGSAAGGNGGGGAGGAGVDGTAGTANTGGGGGGSASTGNGGAGGSGIVIVRYLV